MTIGTDKAEAAGEPTVESTMCHKIPLNDIHYCSFTSQSNVYGLSHVVTESGDVLILASTHSKVMCLSYHRHGGEELLPSYKELHFPYIPGDADIISIDSYAHPRTSRISIGITFVKLGEEKMSRFFNVYPEWKISRGDGMPNRSSFVLPFSPLHLYHAVVPPSGDVVWLLTGSDGMVHMYEEKSVHVVCERDVGGRFPELTSLPAPALWIDIHNMSGEGAGSNNAATHARMTAVGCDTGLLLVSKVELPSGGVGSDSVESGLPRIMASWSIKLDSPITVVRFFTTPVAAPSLGDAKHPVVGLLQRRDSDDERRRREHGAAVLVREFKEASPPAAAGGAHRQHVGLIVTSAVERTLVFSNVDHFCGGGVERRARVALPHSDSYDCVLCCCLADIDFDGCDEILLGTYGQEILVYKDVGVAAAGDMPQQQPRYELVSRIATCEPVLGMRYCDVTGDGLRELLVLGLHGIHVLQHDLTRVTGLIKARLQQLAALIQGQAHAGKDAYRALQAECLE